MDLNELKRIRKENILNHKRKKKEYYLRKKLEQKMTATTNSIKLEFDYEKELQGNFFAQTIKEIARKQKSHVDTRKEKIIEKLLAYKEQKQQYYIENRERRLKYDKEYRDKKKEELKEYRKNYYERNKDKILEKQKEKRKSKSSNGK